MLFYVICVESYDEQYFTCVWLKAKSEVNCLLVHNQAKIYKDCAVLFRFGILTVYRVINLKS